MPASIFGLYKLNLTSSRKYLIKARTLFLYIHGLNNFSVLSHMNYVVIIRYNTEDLLLQMKNNINHKYKVNKLLENLACFSFWFSVFFAVAVNDFNTPSKKDVKDHKHYNSWHPR